MAGERSDYPALLPQLQPHHAVDVLNDRVRQVGRLNTAIADWLQERRRLEEQYAAGLRKLSQRRIDDVDLGIFSVPWETLTGAAYTTADSHAALASKIEIDVEQPLRNFDHTNREMQAMTTMQGNLGAMAKDVEKAAQRTDKLKSKGRDADQLASANSELESAQSQWDVQAPYVFESLQAADEARVNHLRDVLTQFQTHELDLVQKSQSTAEHCLNVLLSLQTEDEIKTFALKVASARPTPQSRPHRQSSLPAGLGAASASASRSTPMRAPPVQSGLTPTMSRPDDGESQRSGSVQEEKKKSRFGGLKRLGTVVSGKRKEGKAPQTLAPMTETPEKKSKSSPFSSFGGRIGKNKEPSLEPPQESPSRERPRSPLRIGSEIMEPSPQSRGLASGDVPQLPHVNGTSSRAFAASIPNGSHQSDLADLEPPKPIQVETPSIAAPQRDSEGFSIPQRDLDPITQAQLEAAGAGGAEAAAPAFNVNIRNAPIREEGGDDNVPLASVVNKLQAPPTAVGRNNTIRGRRNRPVSSIPSSYVPPADDVPALPTPTAAIRASSLPREASTQPVDEQSRAIASPTVAPVTQSSSTGFPAAASVAGGAAAATAAAGAFFPFSAGPSSPFRPESRSAAVADHSADTGSIRSGRSLSSTTSQANRHPDLHEVGLNSSILETISAHFDNGQLTSSTLVGEIALAYNPADRSTHTGAETIRLENFASLDKVAPNPAFISNGAKEGEYSLSLPGIAKTQVAFKYQLRSEAASAHAPLLITPAYKFEPTQASIIVSLSLNPAFNLHGRESITLSNAALALTLEGAKASSVQSKPGGTFSKEKNLIFWPLPEVVLKAGDAPTKLLARFVTDSVATGGTIDAKWEITGEQSSGLEDGLTVSVQSHGADPFADEEGLTSVWKGVPGVRKLTSGTYQAK
ncbi:Muniscin C-terminal mu homology domain [Teratosphaeria destructans]|uniref:Muniscin C-terminal mu homology domain n=1 Tax=Teratosphaeria destructans TaxID=418781 RepID=A0A9W7W4R9_9PEZI|nr:Muniscin C-terminal mu homology domain [Teratosphaeria destructans]